MPYTHFFIMVEYMDRCEQLHARYNALAFNAPKALFEHETHEEVKYIAVDDKDAQNELLRAINGK